MTIEKTILSNLLFNEEYTRKVLPFIKDEYFRDNNEKLTFNLIQGYISKYNALPSKEALRIDLQNKNNLSEPLFKSVNEIIDGLENDKKTSESWLVEHTEKFCQDQALFNAISKSIQLISGDDKVDISKGAIPELLSTALSVSFDTNIGHDLVADWERRFELYHTKETKIPFNLDYFNKITKGGLSKKTLNICLAGTGVGKSMFMCHCAAGNLIDGLNVLYITLEMAEERIAERIDANLMNIAIDELSVLPKDVYQKKIEKIKSKTIGKLIIKEYPTASAGANNFRYLLNELKLKKNFKPDIIYVDYLNICNSSRLKVGSNVNSYLYVKAIAEELRGLAVEHNLPIVSATQTNRTGYTNSDVGLEDTSESFGLPATADFMFAIITNDQLANLNQLLVKQLKNRYSDPNANRKFIVGVDRSKMKLYNVEQSAQRDIIDDAPVQGSKNKFDKSVFEGFT
jgi:archaellum biogenesis ATPase FlaH